MGREATSLIGDHQWYYVVCLRRLGIYVPSPEKSPIGFFLMKYCVLQFNSDDGTRHIDAYGIGSMGRNRGLVSWQG